MKCARCGREMDKAAAFVGGYPIGPKCWEKMGDKPLKFKRVEVVKLDQMELFNEDVSIPLLFRSECVQRKHSDKSN